MDIALRPAVLADAPALTACIDAAYGEYRTKGIDLPAVSSGVSQEIADQIVWLAVEGDDILGGVILSLADDRAYLMNIAVHPDHAGHGIGRALMDRAVTSARAAGHTAMHLTTHKDMPGNIALYRHLGWHVAGQADTKVHMSLSLT